MAVSRPNKVCHIPSLILFVVLSFPIREYGMNYDSQPLQPHEAQAMRASPEIMERVKRSYKTMLSFYGMTLLDEETGLIDRSPPPTFQSRYRNLVSKWTVILG